MPGTWSYSENGELIYPSFLSTSKIPQLRQLTLENLTDYLLETGWKRVPHPHPRRVVFEKLLDNGDSIDLILPSRPNLSDHLLGLAEAVNIIAVAEDVSPDEVIRKIRHMDRDVFNVRLLTPAVGASNGSLSLAVAAREVLNLRKLFAFSPNGKTNIPRKRPSPPNPLSQLWERGDPKGASPSLKVGRGGLRG